MDGLDRGGCHTAFHTVIHRIEIGAWGAFTSAVLYQGNDFTNLCSNSEVNNLYIVSRPHVCFLHAKAGGRPLERLIGCTYWIDSLNASIARVFSA